MAFIIPYPLDTDIQPLSIQYPISHPNSNFPCYDISLADAFEEYPRRCKFGSAKDLNLNRDEVDVAAFMQSWLFYGILKEILNDKDERGKIIDPWLDRLGGTVDIQIDASLEEHLLGQTKKRLEACRNLLRKVERYWNQFDEKPVTSDSVLALTCLSVRLLLDHLWTLLDVHKSRTSPADEQRFRPFSAKGHSSCAELLLQRIQEGGRCPWRAKSAHSQLDCTALYFLSSLRSLQPNDRHTACSADKDICEPSIKAFEAIHTQEGCQCPRVFPLQTKVEEINEIIDAGHYPLISMHHNATGQIELRVVKSSLNAKYTAISHVWSDGELGYDENSGDQACYQECQLKSLGQMLGALERLPSSRPSQFNCITSMWQRWRPSKEKLFWLDSLCIPTESRRRRLQISRMGFIYSKAHEVLVLDKELKNIDSVAMERIPADLPEASGDHLFVDQPIPVHAPAYDRVLTILGHITCSTWMGRAWTLQEGILSKDSVFQLRDCSVRLKSLSLMNYIVDPTYLYPRYPVRLQAIIMSLRMYPAYREPGGIPTEILYALLFLVFLCFEIAFLLVIPWPADRMVRNGAWYFVPWKRSKEDASGIEYRRILQLLSERLQRGLDTNPIDPSDVLSAERFMKIWNLLLDRLATKEEDYITIVSTLAGFEMSKLSAIESSQERLRYILLNLEWIPRSILFARRPYRSRQLRVKSPNARTSTYPAPAGPNAIQPSAVPDALGPREPASTLCNDDGPLNQTSLHSERDSAEPLAPLGFDFDWWIPTPCREELVAKTDHDKLYVRDGAIAYSPLQRENGPVLLYKLECADTDLVTILHVTVEDPQARIWLVENIRLRSGRSEQANRMESAFLFLQDSFRDAREDSQGSTHISAAILFERNSFGPAQQSCRHYFEYHCSLVLTLFTTVMVAGASHVNLRSIPWPDNDKYYIMHGESPKFLLKPNLDEAEYLRHSPNSTKHSPRPLTRKSQVLARRSWPTKIPFFIIPLAVYIAMTIYGVLRTSSPIPQVSWSTFAIVVVIGIPFYIWIPFILLCWSIEAIDYWYYID